MIIINTTFHVENSIKHKFLDWLLNTYRPQSMASGLFESSSLSRVLLDQGDDCSTYAFQLTIPSLDAAMAWHDGEGDALRQQMYKICGAKALCFTTYLETMD